MRDMTRPEPQLAGPLLLGREPECAAIGTLLADARAGAGRALVVRGEAGIGKSALLEYARQRAAPMMVLSAAGVEAEADLAFAGLHELLRPVLGCWVNCPSRSRGPWPERWGWPRPRTPTACSSRPRC
jgi:AAA ATPase domain